MKKGKKILKKEKNSLKKGKRAPFLLAALLALAPAGTKAQDTVFEDAFSAAANMRVGWNLGNTLDSNSGDTLSMWIEANKNRTTASYETAWGQKVTQPGLFRMFKQEGFNAIRIPVTWYPHMEATFNDVKGYSDANGKWAYTPWLPSRDDIGTQVDDKWMARVKQVVDYAIAQDMYCILNVHHDTGAANTAWLIADETHYQQQHERFEALWRQIAEVFKDYGEKLLFEAYNEMLDDYDSWCFASYAAPNRYNAAVATSAYVAINNYAQSFVNAVRSTGGNNAQRNLIVSTYGACSGSGTWNSHLKDPLKQMELPDDSAEGHILFEVHSYPNISNLSSAKAEVKDMLKALQTHLASKGAPVVIGEWGTSDGNNDYENNRANLATFAKDFVQQAKEYGFPTFYWMGLSDGIDRPTLKWSQPEIKDAIIQGYYGDNGYDSSVNPAARTDMQHDNSYYNILGQPVANPGPGLYIKNGKKVYLK